MSCRRLSLFVVAASLALAGFNIAAGADDSFDPARYLDHIKFLASPEMKGRATGSPELEKAAAYIADQFKADGIPPVPGQSGYLQPFEVTTSASMGRNNRFDVAVGSDLQTLQVSKEFIPVNFSSSGKASASVVFAGYGITAPENNYDDYKGLDVKEKFVLVLAHEPREHDPKSVGNAFYAKASNAKAHGARGVILVNDRINHASDADDLERFGATEGPADAGILFVQVKEEVVKPWFQAAGKDIGQLEKDIDTDLQPRSFALPRVEVRESVDVERAVKTAHNVVAYLPGQTDEYIVIGAHYDHLGLGGRDSLAPSLTGTVHPGADDNASGTAGVLELARYFASQPKPKRGFLFMTFAGEELGLLGSGYYTKHPELPLAKAVTMINMDMIGRVQNGKLYIGGAGTGTTLRSDLDQITPRFGKLKIDYSGNDGYGSSDHTSFTAQQVPVLFFFSGLHGDYHKPSDTWDKIDSIAAVQVLRLVADVASRIDNDAERPQFLRVEPTNPHSGSAGPVSGSGGGGYGPDFGSIPDFAEPPKGVRFADVRPGSPAALSGLKGGDILVKFGDRDIANLYDFTYALRAHKPGDEVQVEVLRPGLPGATGVEAKDEKITVKVKLTARK